jgi:SHS2 domain-containing protein
MEYPRRYETMDHTADLGVRIFGRSCEEIFTNAAYALFDLWTDLQRVQKVFCYPIAVQALDRDDLLIRWLSELLFLGTSAGYLFRDFSISQFNPTSLRAVACGEKFDPSRHEIKTEIKAVTYHQVEIREKDGAWEAQVIFDI